MNKKIMVILSALMLCSVTAFSATAENTTDLFFAIVEQGNTVEIDWFSSQLDDAFFKTLTEKNAAPETDFAYAFNKTKDGVVIIGYTGSAKTVIIPCEIEGYPVTDLEKKIFYNNRTVKTVIMPDTIRILPEWCFAGTYLQLVYIPGSIKTIPKECFRDCTELASVIFANGIKTIKENAFVGCSQFKRLRLPDSVKTIEDHAFYSDSSNMGNPYFEEIQFGSSLETIGKEVFCYANVQTLEFPASLKTIGERAFYKSRKLKSVSFASGSKQLTHIGKEAFSFCHYLERVDFGNSVESIGDLAFVECVRLQEINLGTAVKTVGAGCFRNNSGAELLVLSKNLKTIGAGAFDGCSRLRNITIPSNIKHIDFPHSTRDDSYHYYPKDYSEDAFRACGKLKLTVRAQLEELGYNGTFTGSSKWEPFEK